MRFDQARHEHRIFEALIDLDLLVGDPALDLVKRAGAEDLAVHHRHGLGSRRAGILRHDRLGGVDCDLLRRGLRRCRSRCGNGGLDAVRLTGEVVIGAGKG